MHSSRVSVSPPSPLLIPLPSSRHAPSMGRRAVGSPLANADRTSPDTLRSRRQGPAYEACAGIPGGGGGALLNDSLSAHSLTLKGFRARVDGWGCGGDALDEKPASVTVGPSFEWTWMEINRRDQLIPCHQSTSPIPSKCGGAKFNQGPGVIINGAQADRDFRSLAVGTPPMRNGLPGTINTSDTGTPTPTPLQNIKQQHCTYSVKFTLGGHVFRSVIEPISGKRFANRWQVRGGYAAQGGLGDTRLKNMYMEEYRASELRGNHAHGCVHGKLRGTLAHATCETRADGTTRMSTRSSRRCARVASDAVGKSLEELQI
ncbi:hypothetical protein B0H11DRAFT_2196071 [Mycena galericulata]|nr:hypothetical protein B0H11DRAFT_2196071 [Mycena galericulata]